MEHLPPVGWADVATKRDLDVLRTETKRDLDGLRTELKADLNGLRADFAAALHDQTRTMVSWLLAAMSVSTITVGALAFAAARLI